MDAYQSHQAFARPHHGYCDSYFVESHEDQEKRRREEIRECERQHKTNTQINLAQHLSDLASREYRDDHLREMEKMELETLPDVASIDIQTEIKWYMRPYLLDFLIEAHAAFGLLPETLFLTVNLLDRYCSRRIVYKKHYQLVGCAALLIASKYGDRKDHVPTIKELKGMCCALYEDDMFLQMEWHVLQTLNWIIGHPTIDSFIQVALERLTFDEEVECMAYYIAEIGLFERQFVGIKASDMARSSLALARCVLGRPQEHVTEWAGQFDSQTLLALASAISKPSKILSRKYASAQLCRVSLILEDFLIKQDEASRLNNALPPTPPSEACVEDMNRLTVQPVTPCKQPVASAYMSGCLTPPDTPTNDEYHMNQQVSGHHPPPIGGHRPPTPPMMDYQHYTNQNRLPPISSLIGAVY